MNQVYLLPLAALLGACGVQLPNPSPSEVRPAVGWNGEVTPVRLLGSGFYPAVQIDSRASGDDVDREFRAWLTADDGTRAALSGLSLISTSELGALVPEGLQPGLWGLEVQAPTGLRGTLPDAFLVKAIKADRLSVDSDQVVYEVNQNAWIEVALVDVAGERVLEDLSIVVSVRDDAGGGVTTTFTNPEGFTSSVNGWQTEGSLGADDGYAFLGLRVSEPATLTLSVASQNVRSGVSEGTLKLRFEPSSRRTVVLSLPQPDLEVVAGEPFTAYVELVDEFGNRIEDAAETVGLTNACGGWVDSVEVSGRVPFTVRLTKATGGAVCLSDHLITFFQPGEDSVSSREILVHPAPADRFRVSPFVPVVAGNAMPVLVQPRDPWNNPTSWAGSLTLTDSLGSISASDYVCDPNTTLGQMLCAVSQVTVADDAIVLTVVGDDGVRGDSDPYRVFAGPATELSLTAPAVAVAGESFDLVVGATDSWGNTVVVDSALAGLVLIDPLGELSCGAATPLGDGSAVVSCVLTTASAATQIDAALAGLSASAPLAVRNGPLAAVTLTPTVTSTTAGMPITVDLVAVDAWGNAYLDGARDVDLSDSSGSLTPVLATLNVNGLASPDLVFTVAGSTVVRASQAGVELGHSPSIDVAAAGPDHLQLNLDSAWVFVGAGDVLRVEALDAFGNRASYDGSATVRSTSSIAPDLIVALVNGVGSGVMGWTAPALEERLEGISGSLQGSTAVLVVADCGPSGPTTVLDFGGFDEAIACWDPAAARAELSISLRGSTAGVNPLYRYGIDDGVAASVNASGLFNPYPLSQIGRHTIRALVADTAGCGSEVQGNAWVGEDDGEAVGPLLLNPASTTLSAGLDSTDIDISGGVDCARDAAAGATVYVRTDRGEILGAVSSGAGLALTLDAVGAAHFSLDATPVLSGGPATVQAWVASGAAGGRAVLTIQGDDANPVVWGQQPSGDLNTNVAEVRLTFSEPLHPSTIDAINFAVNGLGAVVQGVYQDGADVVIQLQDVLDGAAGTYTVTASTEVRDLAGNRLDGGWSGTAPWEDYVGSFGAVGGDVAVITRCTTDTMRFRPNGDDGAGEEADTVTVTIESDIAPTWWVASVRDSAGVIVDQDTLVPLGAHDQWTWDGREVGGAVLANGSWTLQVEAMDGLGNRGVPCVSSVIIDNQESP